MKREGKIWGGKVFEAWEKKGSKRGEGGGTEEDERGPMVEPALVKVDGWECEYEVAEPVGQAEEVWVAG